jgi:hypothetical protein
VALRGIFGVPYVSLDERIDLAPLAAIHEEVCLALTQVPTDFTGGCHRSMGIMPPSRTAEALVDYGEALRSFERADIEAFSALADEPFDPDTFDPDAFGEEKEHPLSRRQMLWLETRFKVYFPWKAYVELIPNRYWTDKATPKAFSRIAHTFFPKTVAFVRSLPFVHVGRCNVMGLRAHDHGTVHRDGDPEAQREPDHFMTFCPLGDKRLYLWDEESRETVRVAGRAYWFNDHDYHGVDADPFFRYSIRVDGVFQPEFLESLRSAR